MPSKKAALRINDTTLISNGGSSVSPWFDNGRHCAFLTALRTNTGGTYGLEIDWSRDGGSTTLTTDTITTSPGVAVDIPTKARWYRARARNTGGAPLNAHSTQVFVDAAGGSG